MSTCEAVQYTTTPSGANMLGWIDRVLPKSQCLAPSIKICDGDEPQNVAAIVSNTFNIWPILFITDPYYSNEFSTE